MPGATIAGTNVTGRTLQLNSGATVTGLTVSNAFSGGTGGQAILIADTALGAVVTNNTIIVTQSGTNGAVALSFGANTGGTVSGNTIMATGSGTATTMTGLGMNLGGTFTITGNSIGASGGTTNNLASVAGATITSGSTGNTRGSGNCTGAPTSGSIGFTNGTTCP
jgi:hypothetical protein